MRLVSLAPSNTEILYALGLGDHVVARTAFCDWPHEAARTPIIGSWIRVSPERIASFKPDLIFTSYFLPDSMKEWKGPGAVLHVEPRTLGGVYASILEIGVATGRISEAEQVVAGMKEGFERIAASGPGFRRRPRIYMEEWFSPPMASGNWVPELVDIAGGREGIATIGEPSAGFPLSKLTTLNPDIMIFHWCGWGNRFNQRTVGNRSGWDSLRAVREGRMSAIDDSLINRPGPRLVEGARAIREAIVALESKP